jgi:hypothetical protein
MFRLHETTKIRLCRAAFLALCIGPTCAVVGWTAYTHTPTYRRAHEQLIATQLGWQAKVKSATTPRPGLVLYEWVELADPQTGQLVARLPFVEVRSAAGVLSVELVHPATVSGEQLGSLVRLVETLTRRPPEAPALRFAARNLTLTLPGGDQTLTDVCGEVAGGAEGQARLSFRLASAGDEENEPCLLTAGRSSQDAADQTVQLTTGGGGLPAALLAPFWPGATQFGKSSQFAGRIAATRHGDAWRVELAGRVSQIDLDWLVSRQFPHKLTGPAEAQLAALVLADGRIESAQGNITAGPGIISRSLIQSAQTHLGIRAAEQALNGPDNVIAYRRLSADFQLDADGLDLRGGVPQARGAILIDERRVLAVEPPIASQEVLALVRMLVPQSDVHVPATRETAALTSTLPVPSIAMKPESEESLSPPQAKPLNVNPLRSGGETFRR